MKLDTTKLYQKMSSKELAGVAFRTGMHPDSDGLEVKRIVSVVPRFNYSCMDDEFTSQVRGFEDATNWWMIDYFKTVGSFHEAKMEIYAPSYYGVPRNDETEAGQRLHEVSTKLLNRYGAHLLGLDAALEHFDLMVIREKFIGDIPASGYVSVYELEPEPEEVEAFTKGIVRIMNCFIDPDCTDIQQVGILPDG